MLDKILTDEKTFRIFCLILFAVLFIIIFIKNKKEKFGQTRNPKVSPPQVFDDEDFKNKVEAALGDNFKAIHNLSKFVNGLKSENGYTVPGNLTVGGTLNIKSGHTTTNVLTNLNSRALNSNVYKKNQVYTSTEVTNKLNEKQASGRYATISSLEKVKADIIKALLKLTTEVTKLKLAQKTKR